MSLSAPTVIIKGASVTRILTAAEANALNTTAIMILGAPGAGLAIAPREFILSKGAGHCRRRRRQYHDSFRGPDRLEREPVPRQPVPGGPAGVSRESERFQPAAVSEHSAGDSHGHRRYDRQQRASGRHDHLRRSQRAVGWGRWPPPATEILSLDALKRELRIAADEHDHDDLLVGQIGSRRRLRRSLPSALRS